MKNVLLFILISIISIASYGQGFFEHKVTGGESVASIVQKYKISPYEIYDLNPDAKDGLTEGMVLVFLKKRRYPFAPTLVDVKIHSVEKGETLTSISKKYTLSVATLKDYNTKVKERHLRDGYKLRIPVFKDSVIDIKDADTIKKVVTSTTKSEVEHVVLAQETKFGLSQKYDITIEELERLNPHIVPTLKEGMVLKIVKEEIVVDVKEKGGSVSSEYDYYTVQPKEGIFRLTQKLSISEEDLLLLNPALKDGVKLGMIVKYPKRIQLAVKSQAYKLTDSITNFNVQRMSFILPLRLNTLKSKDSVKVDIDKVLKRDKVMNIALDYYSGVEMAIDSLAKLGIQTKVRVFDSDYGADKAANRARINEILTNDFEDSEVVIGPVFPTSVSQVVYGLQNKGVMVFSPFALKEDILAPNLCQTSPTVDFLRTQMIDYLVEDCVDKNVLIITDDSTIDIKNQLIQAFPAAQSILPREKQNGLVIPKDFQGKLVADKENVVIIETKRYGLIATIVSILDTKLQKYKIKVATTSSQKQFENKGIANRYKAKLNYHFPSVYKQIQFEETDKFMLSYKERYGKYPTKYAMKGFDLTLDIGLRQANRPNLQSALNSIGETVYLENKFNYETNMVNGFVNQASYILRYTPEFSIEEVVFPVVVKNEFEIKPKGVMIKDTINEVELKGVILKSNQEIKTTTRSQIK